MNSSYWKRTVKIMIILIMLTGRCFADIWDDVSKNFWESHDGYLLQWVYLGGDLTSELKTKAVTDNEPSNKKVEVGKGGQPGTICFGPYSKDQGPGHYRAVYRLKISDNTINDVVARVDVNNQESKVIAKPLEINEKDFKEIDKFQEFTVDFEIPQGVQSNMEYRIYWAGKCDLQVDTIKIFRKEDEVKVPPKDKEKVKLKLESKQVMFYASFDNGFNPDYANGYNRGVPRNKLDYIPGKKGKALLLTNGSCYYAGKGNINPSHGTMMVWVNTTIPADELVFEAIMQAKELMLYYHPTVKAFGFFIGPGLFYSAEIRRDTWSANTWHHVAVTWDETGGRAFYLDGAQSASSFIPSGMKSCPIFSIGKGDPGSCYYFHGALDEMFIFDGVLTGDEIKLIYERQNVSEKEIGDL